MAGYNAYPEYKESGVEIVGSIPVRWEIKPLLTVCSFHSGKAHEPYIDDDGAFICVNSRFVSTGGVARKRCTRNLTPAKTGNVLMVMSDLPNGRALAKAFYVTDEQNLAVNQRVCVLSAHQNKSDTKYLYYLLDRNPLFLRHDDGVSQTHLSNALFTKFPTIFPSLPEQKQIARFLDHETGKIDALIEKQQALIALLQEKRQAVISHAVTKGLNPDATMKDSGVEWLGDVPEHWEVKQLGWLVDVKRGSGYQNINMEVDNHDTIEMLRISDMHSVEPVKIVKTSEVVRYTVDADDILVAGTGATAGICMLIESKHSGLVHSYNSIKLRRRNHNVESKFLYYFLCSDFTLSNLDVSFSGSAQHFVDTNGLRNLQILVPPISIQREIIGFVDLQTTKLADLKYKAESAIELMQERRTALISAAVTGKIDVRDWEPAPEA